MLESYPRQAFQLDRKKPELVQRVVFQRIGGHLRLAQVRFLEAIGIDDENAVGLQVADVYLQCRRIHGDEDVDRVPGRVNVVRGKMELVAAYPWQSAGGGPQLRRTSAETYGFICL